jgi:hypothetical protein
MASMAVSDLRIIDQVGTTIGAGAIVRHLDRALVLDAVYRRDAWTLVLMTNSFSAPGQSTASAFRTASVGTVLVARTRAPRRRRGHTRAPKAALLSTTDKLAELMVSLPVTNDLSFSDLDPVAGLAARGVASPLE